MPDGGAGNRVSLSTDAVTGEAQMARVAAVPVVWSRRGREVVEMFGGGGGGGGGYSCRTVAQQAASARQ